MEQQIQEKTDDLKNKITNIFIQVVSHEKRYWYNNRFVRWGRIENDIFLEIDKAFLKEKKDGKV